MSKGDYPALRMIVENGRLVPAGQFDAERLASYRRGAVVMCRFTEEKDRVLVRKWFAVIGLVLKSCDTPWKNKDEAHEAIKLALGIVNLSKTVGGQYMQYPKSLTDLDDPEMTDALEQMTALLSRMTGVDVETLKKETAHIGSDHPDHSSNPDEHSPSSSENAGDAALQSPATAAGEVSGPPSASPAATIPATEWLVTATKMLWAATNVGGDTDANLDVLNNQRLAVAELAPSDADQGTRDKAGTVYRQCKQVVMSQLDREKARKFIAGVAGIEEKELSA